ncbi:hypothetical protein JCM8547_003769 [Rhodosporidiobolus lusitaniae]
MGKWLGRLWVTCTLTLISFLGFSSQLFVVVPSFAPAGLRDPDCVRLLVPFNVLLFCLYLNYYLTVTTDPGRVPAGWEPDWKQMEDGAVEVKKLTGGPRYCRTCRAYKPPRAHHCRQCKRCVLKMDHHCPWVNNCVGHFNYGHFCRFLFFVDAACSYHLWMITKRAFSSLAFFVEPSTSQMVILVANYVLCVPVLLAVGVFSLFHLWSIVTNTTTIEGWEKDKVASLKRRGKIREYRYPYHLGYHANIQSVLGSNVLLWCWPQRAPGTGLSYPTAVGTNAKDQLTWPPRDDHVPQRRRKPRPPPPDAAFTYGSGLDPSLRPSASSTTTTRRRNRPAAAARAPWQEDDRESDEEQYRAWAARPAEEAEQEKQPYGEDEDDVPLGTLAARQRAVCLGGDPGVVEEDEEIDRLPAPHSSALSHPFPTSSSATAESYKEVDDDLDPYRTVRIRRGSEGYEIRPRIAHGAGEAPPPLERENRAYVPRVRTVGGGEEGGESDGSWELAGGGDEEYGEEEEEQEEWEIDEEGDRRRVGSRYKYYVREEDSESDSEFELSGSEGE